MRSHLFKFPTKVIKVHTAEILLSVFTMQDDLSSSTSFHFNLSFTECSFAFFFFKKYLATASRIGGHIKYIIT